MPTEAPIEYDWPMGQAAVDGLSAEEKAGVAAGIGGLALILLVLGIVAAVIVVLAILAATTGIFIVHKKMHTIDNHSFEGEMVVTSGVPMGCVIENPNLPTDVESLGEGGLAGRDSMQHGANPMRDGV